MKTHKRILALLCLVCALAQAPAANAQAEILIGLGAKLIPVVLPIALSAIPMIPVLIQQYMPSMPRLGRRKKAAESSETTGDSNANDSAKANAGDSENGIKTNETMAGEEGPTHHGEQVSVHNPQAVAAEHHAKPRESSEWFLDDENDRIKSHSAGTVSKTISSNQHAASNGSEELRATEFVKAELLAVPAKVPEQPAITPRSADIATPAHSQQQQAETSAATPIIMMNVPE